MKKVFIIVDKSTTYEQMEEIKKAVLDPNRPCIIGSEFSIKQVVNIEFDEVEVINEGDRNVIEFKCESKPITLDMVQNKTARVK